MARAEELADQGWEPTEEIKRCPACGAEGKIWSFRLGPSTFKSADFPCICLDHEEDIVERKRKDELAQMYERSLEKQVSVDLWDKANFETFQVSPFNQNVFDRCKIYNAHRTNEPRSMLVIGNTGTGKTRLVLASARKEVRRLGISARFLPLDLYFVHMFGHKNRERLDYEYEMKTVPFLILDELEIPQKSFDRELMESWLRRLLEHRLGNKLPTLMTLNAVSQDECKQKLGEKINSRVFNRELCEVLQIQPHERDDFRLYGAVSAE